MWGIGVNDLPLSAGGSGVREGGGGETPTKIFKKVGGGLMELDGACMEQWLCG